MHVDYLRMGTFSTTAHAYMMSHLISEARKATHWLQYTGTKTDHTFEGAGQQNGRRHYILHVSGPDAHRVTRDLVRDPHLRESDDVRCRRIDLCHDIEQDLDYRAIADELRKDHENVTVMESPDGWTVYANKRAGDFMVRLYRKFERGTTRLEFECKGHLAEGVYSWLLEKEPHEDLRPALLTIWDSLMARARLFSDWAQPFVLGHDDVRPRLYRENKSIEAKIQWMYNALIAIERLSRDHEAHDRVIDAVNSFVVGLNRHSLESA